VIVSLVDIGGIVDHLTCMLSFLNFKYFSFTLFSIFLLNSDMISFDFLSFISVVGIFDN